MRSDCLLQFSTLKSYPEPHELIVIHASSTNESGAPRIDCLALFAYPLFSTFIWCPMNWLPSAFHASSTIRCGASGDWEMWFLLFSRLVPSPNMCIYVYYVIVVFCCCLYFVLCCAEKRRSKAESRHRLITEKVKTDKISVFIFTFLLSPMRGK